MKKLAFLLAFSLIITGLQAQSDIKFDKTTHNFGKIKKGINKAVVFSFTNNSPKPAVIEFAQAECGCTTPEYKQDPVLKGKKGTIKVTYTAPFSGVFKKKVTVKFAGVKTPIELEIEGEVIL
mgnify:CR=1 FL=1|jgi:hypothetical protein